MKRAGMRWLSILFLFIGIGTAFGLGLLQLIHQTVNKLVTEQ